MTARAWAWEARIAVPEGTDPGAIGGAVTAELCGAFEHDGPCRRPHNTEARADGDALYARTLFVAEAAEEPAVRALIERAVAHRTGWTVLGSGPRVVLPEERELADGLAAAPRAEPGVEIRRLLPDDAERALDGLAGLLVDATEGGASVGYLAPLSHAKARAAFAGWAADATAGGRIVLGAYDGGRLVGTVQVVFAPYPNQPHRGDVVKLLVLRSARRRGIGRLLMARAEAEAILAGRTLLVLDTATDEAERLYEALGWTRVGAVPGYALFPDGSPCDTVFFWKQLAPPAACS